MARWRMLQRNLIGTAGAQARRGIGHDSGSAQGQDSSIKGGWFTTAVLARVRSRILTIEVYRDAGWSSVRTVTAIAQRL